MNPVKLNTVGILSGGEDAKASPEEIINSCISFEALENGLTISFSNFALEYCVDGDGKWQRLEAGTKTASVNKGGHLSFRYISVPNLGSTFNAGSFSPSVKCAVKGSMMGFVRGDLKPYGFARLFRNATNIVYAHELIGPSQDMPMGVCNAAFQGCYSLLTAPILPSKNLAQDAYAAMFYNCENLTSILLPAKTIKNAYNQMLAYCNSLYFVMMAAENMTSQNAFQGVSTSGVLVKSAAATWDDATMGVPESWTVVKKTM